jgi:hypothetical protein
MVLRWKWWLESWVEKWDEGKKVGVGRAGIYGRQRRAVDGWVMQVQG